MTILTPCEVTSLHGAGWTVIQLIVSRPPLPKNDRGSKFLGHEFELGRDLQRHGFMPYIPTRTIKRPRPGWRNHTVEIIRALLPSYVFVSQDSRFVAADFVTTERSVKRLAGHLTEAQIDVVRSTEREANDLGDHWAPEQSALLRTVHEMISAVLPRKRFVALGDLQRVS